MKLTIVAAVFVALLLPGGAGAAAPWSEPESSPASAGAGSATVEFASNGAAILSQGRAVSFSSPEGSFGSTTRLPSGFFAFADRSSMAVEPGAKFFAVGLHTYGRDSYSVARLRGGAGHVGALKRVGPASAARYAFASNARGDAALLTQVSQRAKKRSTRRAIYIQVRRAGGELGQPIRVAGGGRPASLAVAINARRQVLIVWARDRQIVARQLSPSRHLTPARLIGRFQPDVVLSAGIADSGRAVIAWAGGFAGESPAPTSGAYFVAVAPPAGKFTTSQLDVVSGTSHGVGLSNVLIRATGDDRLTLAWTGQQGDRAVVKVADIASAGRSAAQVISPLDADSLLVDFVGGAGEAVALYDRAEDTGKVIGAERFALDAAVRAPGAAAFGEPEEIAGFGSPLGADVAVDPTSGRAIATWIDFGGGKRTLMITARPPAA